MPIDFSEYEKIEIVQKLLYKNGITGYEAAVKLVGEKVAIALLVSILKKIAAEKYFPKINDESAAAKGIREEHISNFVLAVLETNKIITRTR